MVMKKFMSYIMVLIRRLKKFPKKKKEILFVGRLVSEKGVDLICRCCSDRIANKFPDWQL